MSAMPISRPCTSGSTSSKRSGPPSRRSEEHTSELQSRLHLVCRLLLEKKNTQLLSAGIDPGQRDFVLRVVTWLYSLQRIAGRVSSGGSGALRLVCSAVPAGAAVARLVH